MQRPGARCSVLIRDSQALALVALTLLLLLSLHALRSSSSAAAPLGYPVDGVATVHAAGVPVAVEAPANPTDRLDELALAAATAVLLLGASQHVAPTPIRRLVGSLTRPLFPPPRAFAR